MAYAIASLSDGRILYSDGSKKYPASGYGSSVQNSGNSKPASGYGSQYQNDLTAKDSNYKPSSNSKSSSSKSSSSSNSSSKSSAQKEAEKRSSNAKNYSSNATNMVNSFISSLQNLRIPNNTVQASEQNASYEVGTTPTQTQSTSSVNTGLNNLKGNFSQLLQNIKNPVINNKQMFSPTSGLDIGLSEFLTGKGYRADQGGDVLGDKTMGSNSVDYSGKKNSSIVTDSSLFSNLPASGFGSQFQNDGTEQKRKDTIANNFGFTNNADNGTSGYNSTFNDTVSGTGDFYVALQDANNQIIDNYTKGTISQKEAEAQQRDLLIQTMRTQGQYLDKESERLKGTYGKMYDEGVQSIDSQLNTLISEADTQKTANKNSYEDLIRQAVKNKQLDDAKRGNIFSSLGTAESSAYIDNQGQADRSFGSAQNKTELQKMDSLNAIDTQILQAKTKADQTKTSMKNDRDDKITQLLNSQSLSKAEIEQGITDANIKYVYAIKKLDQSVLDLQNQLAIQDKNSQVYLDSIYAQGNIQGNLINQQYALNNASSSNMPTVLDTELRNYVRQGASNPASLAKLTSLYAQYPEWKNLIGDVIAGKVPNEAALDNAMGTSKVPSTSYANMIGGGLFSGGL